MDQEKVGKFIVKCRKEKNMTQQELAEKLGVTDRAISKWENGRGMPELSLMLPLCKELDITINELLSGEKIKKEEYQEKLEENIINTFEYSNKKIKKIKLVFIGGIACICLILIILLGLFVIDVTRMKNNKPVLFSTWGYEYVPPIDLNQNEIFLAIREYLIQKDDGEIKHYDNEKGFVSYRAYLIEEKSKELYYVYAWVVSSRYYLENDKLEKDSGSSIPYKFKVEKINEEYKVTDLWFPRDGSYYKEDMEDIFPASVREDMERCQFDGTIEKLLIEVEEQAKLYFHK